MKTDKNGQGVIKGVETDVQYSERLFKEELHLFKQILPDTHKYLSQAIHTVLEKETYRANLDLDIIRCVLSALQTLVSKNDSTGTIKIKVRPDLLDNRVEVSWNAGLFEDGKQVGKTTNKKVLIDKTNIAVPLKYDEFDSRQSERSAI